MSQQNKSSKDKVRFIRKNGRIIPIKAKPGESSGQSPRDKVKSHIRKMPEATYQKHKQGFEKGIKTGNMISLASLSGIAGSAVLAVKGRGKLAAVSGVASAIGLLVGGAKQNRNARSINFGEQARGRKKKYYVSGDR